MKNLPKIIALFIVIFITGIFFAVKRINSPLNTPQETVEVQKDSIRLEKQANKTV